MVNATAPDWIASPPDPNGLHHARVTELMTTKLAVEHL